MLPFAFIFVVLFPLCLLHGNQYAGEYGKLIGALAAFGFSLVISLLIRLVDGKSGGQFSVLSFGKSEPLWKVRERQTTRLREAKHLKGNAKFQQSLKILDELLKEDPNLPEAMFLKAQIYAHGLKDINAAGSYLKQLLKQTARITRLNEQALQLYQELDFHGAFDEYDETEEDPGDLKVHR